jgi:hypothetical protein
MDHYPDQLAQPPHRNAQAENKGNGKPLSFICFYVWLEKYFSRGDYRKPGSDH